MARSDLLDRYDLAVNQGRKDPTPLHAGDVAVTREARQRAVPALRPLGWLAELIRDAASEQLE